MDRRTKCLFVLLFGGISLLNSCKKNSNGPASPDYDDSTQISQSVTIRITATKPSPSDSVNTPLADSVFFNQEVAIGKRGTGISLAIGAVNQPDNYTYPGFEFSCYYDGEYPLGHPLIIIDQNAVPSVTPAFQTGTTYSNTSLTQYLLSPVFETMEGVNSGGVGKYFTGSVPTDASDTALSDTTYCQVVFSNKFTARMGADTFRYASGVITGYQSLSYGKFSATKYVQRWDFSIDFTNYPYNLNY